MKRKRKRSSLARSSRRQLFLQRTHPTERLVFAWLLLLSLGPSGVVARAGDAGRWAQTADSSTKSDASKKAESPENQFLVFGTVFIDPGFALPGAEIQVRRAGERKVRRRCFANGRGECELRIPKGAEYEVVASAKCCTEMMRPVDARNGDRADLVFKLVPKPKGKKK